MTTLAFARVSLISLAASFLNLGLTTFGGMWAAAARIEAELVVKRHWLRPEDMGPILVAASLVPAPSYLGLAAIVGYRLRGWIGGLLALICVSLPAATLTVLAVVAVSSDLLSGPLAPLRRTVAVAVVGILFGTARRQLVGVKVPARYANAGLALAAATTVALVAGLPMLPVALIGLALGALVIRAETAA